MSLYTPNPRQQSVLSVGSGAVDEHVDLAAACEVVAVHITASGSPADETTTVQLLNADGDVVRSDTFNRSELDDPNEVTRCYLQWKLSSTGGKLTIVSPNAGDLMSKIVVDYEYQSGK